MYYILLISVGVKVSTLRCWRCCLCEHNGFKGSGQDRLPFGTLVARRARVRRPETSRRASATHPTSTGWQGVPTATATPLPGVDPSRQRVPANGQGCRSGRRGRRRAAPLLLLLYRRRRPGWPRAAPHRGSLRCGRLTRGRLQACERRTRWSGSYPVSVLASHRL